MLRRNVQQWWQPRVVSTRASCLHLVLSPRLDHHNNKGARTATTMGQRWKRYIEIYLFCSVWPIGMVATVYAGWRMMLWSYGGRQMFRQAVITDPLDEDWHLANPRQVFFRDAPLAHLPDYLKEYQESLEPPKDWKPHNHHENF